MIWHYFSIFRHFNVWNSNWQSVWWELCWTRARRDGETKLYNDGEKDIPRHWEVLLLLSLSHPTPHTPLSDLTTDQNPPVLGRADWQRQIWILSVQAVGCIYQGRAGIKPVFISFTTFSAVVIIWNYFRYLSLNNNGSCSSVTSAPQPRCLVYWVAWHFELCFGVKKWFLVSPLNTSLFVLPMWKSLGLLSLPSLPSPLLSIVTS